MMLITGCATTDGVKLNTSLPTINSLKTISDMTSIAFEWKPINDDNVYGYYLYRSNPNENNKMNLVAMIKDRFATHYVDNKLAPGTQYKYELRTYDKQKNVSNSGEIITVSTANLIDSVSFAQAIYGLPNRVKILWRPSIDPEVGSYIIERSDISSDKWYKIAEIKGRLNAEYIDTGLDSNHHYRYRILLKTFDGIISKPSEIISAQTKALPNLVTNLVATTDLPKKISLTWDANTNPDFSHYNIYRSSNDIFPMIKIVQTKENKFDDLINANGSQMFYKVTAVDNDGLESQKQQNSVIGSTLTAPKQPIITGVAFNGVSIELSWQGGIDNRSVKYTIYKSSSDGNEIINDIVGNSYNDSNMKIGNEYSYTIVGTDQYDINSKESKKAIVVAK